MYTVLSPAHVPAYLPRPYALSPCGIRASPAQVAKQKLLLEKEEKQRAEWIEKCKQLQQLGRRPNPGDDLYRWFIVIRHRLDTLTEFRRKELDKALPSWNEPQLGKL